MENRHNSEKALLLQLQKEEHMFHEGPVGPTPRGHHDHHRFHHKPQFPVLWTTNPAIDGIHRRGPTRFGR